MSTTPPPRLGFSLDQVKKLIGTHPLTEEQKALYGKIGGLYEKFAEELFALVPDCASKTYGYRLLKQSKNEIIQGMITGL